MSSNIDSDHIPCPTCNWTPDQRRRCSYNSNINLFYGAGDRGAWSLGSKFILKDRGCIPPIYESINVKFVKENTTIPTPAVVHEWSENDRNIMIVERVPGKTLEEVWPSMTEAQKEALAKKTVEYLSQLRQLHGPKMQTIHGQPLHNGWLVVKNSKTSHGLFTSEDELFDAISGNFKDTPDEVVSLVKGRMPSPFPWTFTHADLTICNIMVDPETCELTGIIDWEASGYCPVWWDYVGQIGLSEEDTEWKRLLRKNMQNFSGALEWYKDVYACRDRMEMREERWEKLMMDAGLSIEPPN
ncbi:hypothetical protein N7478_005825 [Penicillium angulare]|uniref:uncharacterized protein n=1 Tax=Penicillium angulare TaxID=116970 RepID=UPI002540D7C2|nr:uncharacterized protein N7478_005825 [Penicillium angulare]KAJ5280453.1 hypothetical protein N7478_005825 [Penicillium angulare]